MTDCHLCDRREDLIEGTVMRRSSSGGTISLCESCWALLDRARCALCGTTDLPDDPARRHTVAEHDENGRGGPLCSSCYGLLG